MLDAARARLQRQRLSALDAEVLLAHVLARPRSYLYTHPEAQPSAAQRQQFEDLLDRRLHGEPCAYLLGHQEFWSLSLKVNPHTLIPRPETEHLVECALLRIPQHQPVTVADLGTGSGANAIAIARERPAARIIATDLSRQALALARENASRYGLENIRFVPGNWFAALAGIAGLEKLDVLVSNPPYIAAESPYLAPLRFEPRQALVAPDKGLGAISILVGEAPRWLKPMGWLLVEHGYDQQAAVATNFARAGFKNIRHYPDYNGIARVCEGQAEA